jgi:hypothetical protein
MVGRTTLETGQNFTFRYATVHTGGHAYWLSQEALEDERRRDGTLHDLLLDYMAVLSSEARLMAKCKSLHATPARLSHWLLVLRERTRSDELIISQEFIAQRLGISPCEATLASGFLWREKLIRFDKTHITILDHEKLQVKACACSATIHHKRARLFVGDSLRCRV